MKLAVIYIMELFPCYGRELCLVGGGHMLVSEQETVNYPSVEVKKLTVFGRYFFWTKNYALIVERNPIIFSHC